LCFAEIITLLVAETNRYYHDHLDRLDQGPYPQPDMTEAEMLVFLAITISMGHCIQDELTEYWSRADNFHTPFYGNAMPRDSYLHILRFLHFTDNKKVPDMNDENSDRLWKIRNLFNILNDKHKRFGIKIYKLCDETGYTYDMTVYL